MSPPRSTSLFAELGHIEGILRIVGGCLALLIGGVTSLVSILSALFMFTSPSTSVRTMLISVGSTIGVVLATAVVAALFFAGLPRARRQAWLREHGVRRLGRVRSIASMRLARWMRVTVEHQTPDGPRVGETTYYIPKRAHRPVVVGGEVELLVHPDDPEVFSIVIS